MTKHTHTHTHTYLSIKKVVSVCLCVCDGHISLTVSQTDLRFWMWLAHGTKLCSLDFQDFSLCFSKDNDLRRPSSRGSVLFPSGPLLGGAPPQITVIGYTWLIDAESGGSAQGRF